MEEKKPSAEFEEKAKTVFHAERREDYAVLIIATVVVLLVLVGVIDKKVIDAIFIWKY